MIRKKAVVLDPKRPETSKPNNFKATITKISGSSSRHKKELQSQYMNNTTIKNSTAFSPTTKNNSLNLGVSRAMSREVRFGDLESSDNIIENRSEILNNKVEPMVKQVYEEHYSNEKKGKPREMVTELLGNAMIGAFMESLINLSLEELGKMKQSEMNNSCLSITPKF